MTSDIDTPAPVAIVGMACRLPKANNYREYWRRLIEKENCISDVPEDRWMHQGVRGGEVEPDRLHRGGFMDGVDMFDAQFFGRLPGDARATDPQHRIMLELSWSCLEDAGYPPSELEGKDVGVYLGVCNYDYKELYDKYSATIETPYVVGNGLTYLANQISHFFNFNGPSICCDTACSSSLVAVHQAVTALRQRECSVALAGGINVIASYNRHLHFSRLGMLSQNGQCYSFDGRADGYVRGEGAGILLLKPLERALRDRDIIHGVIKGSAVNHVGKARTLTSPNTFAQSNVISKAIKTAGIRVDTISHIEAHGTGTPLGDPIEINGLKRAFGSLTKQQLNDGKIPRKEPAELNAFCGIGTAKTNIGHLESAAGVAGLIKVILSMNHGHLPALQNFEKLNEKINLSNSPFYLLTEARDWTRLVDEQGAVVPRRAGINSFGLGGTNAHVVVEELIDNDPDQRATMAGEELLVLISARTETQLREYAEVYIAFFSGTAAAAQWPEPDLHAVAYTTQLGREMMNERLSIICSSKEELVANLKSFLKGKSDARRIRRGTVNGELPQLFGPDEEDKIYIEQLIRNRNLTKLAGLWTQGVVVPWEQLDAERQCRRVPLPTYPFHKTRYWLPLAARHTLPAHETTDNNLLVDRQLIRIGAVECQRRLKSGEWMMAEHRVRGEEILPGVAVIEMVRAAIEKISGNENQPITLLDLVWERAVKVAHGEVNVRTILEQSGNRTSFRMVSIGDDQQEILHARGDWEIGIPSQRWTRRLGDLIESHRNSRTVEELYRRFREAEIEYGTPFQTLSDIRLLDTSVLNRLERPKHGADRKMKLDVTVIDGALQGIKALPRLWDDRDAWVPIAVDRVEIHGPVQGDNLVYIEEVGARGATYVANIDIMDGDGNGLVKLTGLRIKSIGGASAERLPAQRQPSTTEEPIMIAPRRDQRVNIARAGQDDKRSTKERGRELPFATDVPTISDERHEVRVAKQIRSFIAEIICEVPERINDDQVFSSCGIDSITGLNLLEKINNFWDLRLKTIVLFDYPTIAKMAAHIAGHVVRQTSVATMNGHGDENGCDLELKRMLHDLRAGRLTDNDVLLKLKG